LLTLAGRVPRKRAVPHGGGMAAQDGGAGKDARAFL
jgi:hypothetical protein